MDPGLLPATTYEMPVRLGRRHVLNTIIEDENSEKGGCCSEEEGEQDNRGRPKSMKAPRSIESTSPVPSLTSSTSSYSKGRRRSEDFDEMYDVSDEDSGSDIAPSVLTSISTGSVSSTEGPKSPRRTNKYPSLIIPSPRYWPTIQKVNTISPPRPPKIPLSPAALSMLGHDLPTSSNPPSLTGSLLSGPYAGSTGSKSSSPVTPNMLLNLKDGTVWDHAVDRQGYKSQGPDIRVRIEDELNWRDEAGFSPEGSVGGPDFGIEVRDFSDRPILASEDSGSELGVQLPPEALDTLRHLSLEIPAQPDFASPTDSEKEMVEVEWGSLTPPRRPSSADVTPMSQHSEYSISRISIPSPGGFFSSLGSNARHTWCLNGPAPLSAIPPSSTTAEQFYNCPWNRNPTTTVERIVEVDDSSTEGPPTARQIPPGPAEHVLPHTGADGELQPFEDHDEGYEGALQETAMEHHDQTERWLRAQTSYMATLRNTYPADEVGLGTDQQLQRTSSHLRQDSFGSPMKKAVRFLETEIARREHKEPKKTGESLYYHAFQYIQAQENPIDPFRHRHTRSDSIQSSRISLPHEHVAHLRGEFAITHVDRPHPQRPISMMPGKDSDKPEETEEQKVIARVERERQALDQLQTGMWVIEATKYLSGGRLLNSPAATKSLRRAPLLSDIENGRVKNPARVLDLGGQPSGDWAWHCSKEYQYARVYTASTERQEVESNIRGPRNHRPTAVQALWQLPYPDKHFNVISARALFAFLKTEKPPGKAQDEYDLCLQECMRCLKPGGYLEFFVMDAEIVNAGSRGSAVSVEFGFNLKTRGYDPSPTKTWLGRVRRAGFDDIKRAWTFLPMGTPTKELPALPETPPPDVSTFETQNVKVEAVQGPVGSTADAANMSGLVGSWAWEQWMLRLQLEMGKEKEKLLEGVGAVLEEGKWTGAGWRCLSGWARKPLEDGISEDG